MRIFVAKARRLGRRQTVALVGASLLTGIAIIAPFTDYPAYAFIPLSLLVLHLTAQVVLLQYRTYHGFRDMRYRFQKHVPLRGPQTAKVIAQKPAGVPKAVAETASFRDIAELFERIEYNQVRILASIETERLEAAERQALLLSKLRQPEEASPALR